MNGDGIDPHRRQAQNERIGIVRITAVDKRNSAETESGLGPEVGMRLAKGVR